MDIIGTPYITTIGITQQIITGRIIGCIDHRPYGMHIDQIWVGSEQVGILKTIVRH